MGVKVRERKGEWWLFIDHKGQRKAVKVGSKQAAKDAARKIEEALTTGKLNLNPPDTPAPVLFKDYAEKWLEGHVRLNRKPSTYRGYKLLLDGHILPAFEDRVLSEITRDEIKALCYGKLEEGRKKPKKIPGGKTDPRLSSRSVSYIARTLSAIFNQAVEDGILAANPAQRPGRYIRTGDRKEKIDFLTPEEGRHLLETTRKEFSRVYPLLLAALRTGTRQGELIALKWTDIDWNGKFIEVQRTNWNGHIAAPKSGKGRRVDMSDQLADVLADHRRHLAALTLKDGRSMAEWVFPSTTGTPWDAANIRKDFSLCLKKAGLRHLRFHDLRHSFASWLIGNGESLAYVREQMGHHSIQITVDTYGHLIPGANRQAVNRLDDPAWAKKAEKSATPAQPGPRVEQREGVVLSSIPMNVLVN